MRDMTTPVLLGDFKIDPVTQVLIRTTDNQSVKLSRSESLIICMLAEQPNVAVSRDALLEDCWTGKVVTNSSLTVAIKHIRSAFSELGVDDVIVTEPKKGYLIRLSSVEELNLENSTDIDTVGTPPAIEKNLTAFHSGNAEAPSRSRNMAAKAALFSHLTKLSRRYLVTAFTFALTVITLSQMALFVESTTIDKHRVLYDGQTMPPAVVRAIQASPEPTSKMIAYPLGGMCDDYQLITIDKKAGFIDITSQIEQGGCRG
ncbi:transcriptional regulator [Photobacterium rosenbergii]|uniref:Winged helix-turn-helix domain-containing protein n=1 Tax=Photobacterium rosenbergii TaxID=294936 RepID=A0ABU3ZFE6_9GAMM|nr:winged helix-turn-helix domain-containing protein [Photobacterium rosenbergii]MDV5168830.1 winged helix-turn-helix domain-containing protein [Photobacterium rosenbergii]